MVKNIIFDVGGIILDDSLDNISKVYGKDMSEVYKKVFTLYIPAGSETLYKEKWNDFVDWRVIDIQTL